MGRKITVKEFYFYQKGTDNVYSIDIISGANKHVHNAFCVESRDQVYKLVEDITKKKHSKYVESLKGMKVYNEFPEKRVLNHNPRSIVEVYMNNLQQLTESEDSSKLAAQLLRSVADFISKDNSSTEIEPLNGVSPENAISTVVPFEVIDYIQEKLNSTINLQDLTFYFNDQKWQLHKAIHELDLPKPKRPKSAPVILNSLDYMSNLLGVNGENSVDPNSLFTKFSLNDEIYKISHIYTRDRVAR